MLEDFSSRAVNRGTTCQEEGATTNSKCGATTQEDEYFTGYGDISVHKLMLSDEPRMAFYGSVMSNPDYIKGKVVVEVGCGSGVISLWSLLHGQASRVIAIEGSLDMAEMAHAVAEENGARVVAVTDTQYRQLAQSMLRSKSKSAVVFDELSNIQKEICNGSSCGVLVLFKGRSTTLINPFDDDTDNDDDATIKANIAQELFQSVFLCNAAVAKEEEEEEEERNKGEGSSNISAVIKGGVDVLVSEWMGFYLVHESMLPSVIEMREFLAEINSSLPTTATRADTVDDDVSQFAPVMVPDVANITGAPVSLIPLFKASQEAFWSNIHWKKTSAVGGVDNSPASSGATVAPPSLRMNTIGLLQFNAELATCAEKGQPLVEQLPLTATTPSSPAATRHHQTLLATPKCIQPLDLQHVTLEGLMVCGGKVVFNDIGAYQQQHDAGDVAVDGFALWFDVGLSVRARDRLLSGKSSPRTMVAPPSSPSTPHSIPLSSMLTLDTSPEAPPTHWKQSVVLLPEEMRTEFKVERRGVGRCSSVVYEMPESALRVSALKGESIGVNFQIVREDYQGGGEGDEEEEDEEGIAAGRGSRLYTVGFELFDPADEEEE